MLDFARYTWYNIGVVYLERSLIEVYQMKKKFVDNKLPIILGVSISVLTTMISGAVTNVNADAPVLVSRPSTSIIENTSSIGNATAYRVLPVPTVVVVNTQTSNNIETDSKGVEYSVPNNESGCRSQFKSYMSYSAVTDESSDQYKLLNADSCYTNSENGLRMVGDRYCIAVGTGYCAEIGTWIDVVLENGNVIKCILSDIKANQHTDAFHRYHSVDGSVVEIVIDKEVFDEVKDDSGTVNFISGFEGKVESIIVYS